MHEYWVFIRNSSGTPMRVTLFAENNFRAIEIAKAMYGSSLMSEGANFIK